MALSSEEVRHIAVLARLALTEKEREKLQEQLSNILHNMEALKEVNTADVPPTAQSVDMENVFRDDVARPSCHPDEVLLNAPEREGGSFKIRAVLE